ncbi:NACHT domain- and WD repeat-containing protein 1-like isoform X2 [Panonychus citri]|uniref:NACHT domain- and WD repeat-containing protein 1-like isoform X2 n=1 Tax=Panonychus citri TaxID=50023 RepID=UPI002307FC52|nr:NACHT domain- and WD repeat-containing protein 1-like isoform X2 [Panonychus citri]
MGTSCSSLKKEDRHKSSVDSGPPTIEERRCSNKLNDNYPNNDLHKDLSAGSSSDDTKKGQSSSELHLARQSSNINNDNRLYAPSVTPSPLPSSQTPSPYTTPSANKQLSITSSGLPNLGIFSNVIRNLLIGQKVSTPRLSLNKQLAVYLVSNNLARYDSVVNKLIESIKNQPLFKGYEIRYYNFNLDHLYIYDDDHRYKEICLNSLEYLRERGRLIPLIILDGEPEKRLLPRTIDESIFNQVIAQCDESTKQLIEKWYYKDSNQEPTSYVLHPISKHLPCFKSHSSDERKKALESWYNESKVIIDVLLNETNRKTNEDLITSIICEEIKFIADDTNGMNKNTLLIRLAQLAQFSSSSQSGMNKIEDNISTNRKLLAPAGSADLDQVAVDTEITNFFGENFKKLAELAIEEEFAADSIKKFSEIDNNLFIELVHQNNHRHSLDKHYIGRESFLQQIQFYICSPSRTPLIIHGPRGSGKSFLLSRASFNCSYWSPTTVIIYRSIGLTCESLTVEQTLRSICEQLCMLYGEHISFASEIALRPKETLIKLLSKANEERPLAIIIDGVDQFADYNWIKFEVWLHDELPAFVKVILAMTNDNCLDKFKSIGKVECLDISSITLNEMERILDVTLQSKSRKISETQREFACKQMKEVGTPFYAQVLSLRLSEIQSTTHPDEINDIGNIESTILSFINQLGHIIEPPLMAAIITTLSSTRYGISDAEVMDIIFKSQSLRDLFYTPNVSSFPYSFWSLIRFKLSHFITTKSDDSLINFKTRQIATIVGKYTQKWKDVTRLSQDEMLNYFNINPDDLLASQHFLGGEALTNQWPNRRKAQELGYLKMNLNVDDLSSFVENYCLNLKWICFKLLVCDPFQLLEDLELVKSIWRKRSQPLDGITNSDNNVKQENVEKFSSDLSILIHTIMISAYPLRYHGLQVISQIYSRLNSFLGEPINNQHSTCSSSPPPLTSTSDKVSDLAKKYPKAANIVVSCKKPFVPSLLPLNTQFMAVKSNIFADETNESGTSTINSGQSGSGDGLIEESFYQYDQIFLIKGNDAHVITLSTGRGEISVWNIAKSKPIRVLNGINQPKDLRMIDQYRAVVLCNRDLRIYNLDEGSLVIKLKGVMNQKMPFFGLHSDNYLVALSRNRMYVNMQSLKTGDLETTFKVGEDRFLNSLLVSANGNICVCGDETQKPFPLLVWDLINRKLIYDLRIPHHEFITKLSAISDDGHYVVCVSKELNSTSPNFIIVYDLQSGTLFKKWKPDCNTVSITISSSASCVINCTETALILVWDLSTGAKRLTLQGHIASVDILQVDEKGKTLLSYDSTGKDLSIRLWDLENGSCLAVFTPDQPLSRLFN